MHMNKRIKNKWLKALRSGKYKQGKSILFSDNKYCCLGVLCELAVQDGIIKKSFMYYNTYFDKAVMLLPPKVVKWAGFDKENVSIESTPRWSAFYRPRRRHEYNIVIREKTKLKRNITSMIELPDLNDSGNTFKQIAKVIEKYL